MTKNEEYKKLYSTVLDVLDKAPLLRYEILNLALPEFELTAEEMADNSTSSRKNYLKSKLGATINEMLKKGFIEKNSEGFYRRNADKPVIIRIESCEEEILKSLNQGAKTKQELKDELTRIFKTDKTVSTKDDHQLYTYINQILKRLNSEKAIKFDGSRYFISPAKTAELTNRKEIIALRADFLTLLHSKGGEFFEQYFMTLLEKYLVRCGKRVLESATTGGSDDGGIDGIAKTVDSLGFRETIMVQTKNRADVSTETEIRGFYGAVCASQGTRGIFATSSDFHTSAKKFLDSVDNCVGVNGEKIFSMACDVSYGIKRINGKLTIDRDVL